MIDIYNLEEFAAAFFKITDKKGQLIPFHFNKAQRYVQAKLEDQLARLGYVRVNILKGRQQGISTLIQARFFHKILTDKGTQAFILAHISSASESIFGMTKRFYNNLPAGLAPKADKDNGDQLIFNKLETGYRVGTAGSSTVGRGMTVQLMHLSEYAFYDKHTEIKSGIEQSVADNPGTEKIKESTANGIANAFYADWQDAVEGKSDAENIFCPWYWQDEYTRSADGFDPTPEERDWMQLYQHDGLTYQHLAWRRNKVYSFEGDYEQKCRQFRQEYPFTAEEAFLNSITDTYLSVECVRKARENRVNSDVALVIGVDPARGGIDKSAIIRRRGRCAYNAEKYQGLDTMQLVGKIKTIIDREHPAKVFIDCIGIGAGVVDRLHEMGYDCVIGINVSRQANNPDRFLNLRAELWSEMKEWFNQDLPVQIPDDPELQKELCSLGYKYNSSGRLVIESKEDAKKRGINSPDGAEALLMTFAFGQHVGEGSYQAKFMSEESFGMFT